MDSTDALKIGAGAVLAAEARRDEVAPRRNARAWVKGLHRWLLDAGVGWLLPIGLLAAWEAAARLDLLPETVVPGADRLVASVANFRGKIIPIADLRLAFGLPSADSTMDSRIVVVELDVDGVPTQIGIRTDKVHEVTTLHRDASETPPTVGLRWRRDFIRELVRTPQGVIVLANIARIFDPLLMVQVTGHDDLAPIAAEAEQRLSAALASLPQATD